MADIYRATTYRRKGVGGRRHDARLDPLRPPRPAAGSAPTCCSRCCGAAASCSSPRRCRRSRRRRWRSAGSSSGSSLLAVILLVRRERVRVERRRIGDFVIVGAVMTAIPFVLFALAEQRVTSVLAGLVNATTPLFTAVFVALLLPSERPDRVQVGGLVLGFGGIAVLLGVWNSGAIDLVGGLMLLGATFCYGLGNAWSRRRLTSTGPVERRAAGHPAGRRRAGDPAVRGLHPARRTGRSGAGPGAARARPRRHRAGRTCCSGASWRSPAPR